MDIFKNIGHAATRAGKAVSDTASRGGQWVAGEGRQLINEGTALFQRATAPLQAVRRLVDPTVVFPHINDEFGKATGQN